jgi:hypothetical protein
MTATIDKVKPQHSNYWMNPNDLLESVEIGSVEHLNKLRVVQSAISNFVQIVTGKNIPVVFSSGKMSYTDGKSVIISADLDPSKIDEQVGIALHEASHCLLSNKSFQFLPVFEKDFLSFVNNTTIIADAAIIGMSADQVKSHIKYAMNVMEDRRIDLFMYETAIGYRPYYEALYDKYWHSSTTDNILRDPKYRDTTVENYMVFLINITNQYWDVNALPGLDQIRKIFNLTRDGLNARGDADINWRRYSGINGVNVNSLPLLVQHAIEMIHIIIKNSTTYTNPNSDEGEGDGQPMSSSMNGMPNMDFATPGTGGETRYISVSRKEFKDALQKQLEFLDHTSTDVDKKQLREDILSELDNLDSANAEFKTVSGDFIAKNVKCPIIVFRDVTKQTVLNPKFPMKYKGYNKHNAQNPLAREAITEGIRMGQILAHRIQVIQDDSSLQYTRQTSGRLDKRLIAGLGYDNEAVFHHIVTEAKKPIDIWLDIDMSGSMSGDKFKNSMKLAVAVAYAADKNRKMNCVIAIRDGGYDRANLAIIYDSKRHKFQRIRDVVPYIDASGGTPEALCFEAVRDEILKVSSGGRKYFINLSDGQPGHSFTWKGKLYSYGGENAFKHTREMMKEFRASGITVLSYFIGDAAYGENKAFKSMYQQDARFIDPKNITQIANTLNRIMLGQAT